MSLAIEDSGTLRSVRRKQNARSGKSQKASLVLIPQRE